MKEIGKTFLLVMAGMLFIILIAWNLGDKMKEQVLEQSEYLKRNKEEGAVFREDIESALLHGIHPLNPGDNVPNRISTLIKRFENEKYILIFYLTDYEGNNAAFTAAKLEKSQETPEKYRCITFAGFRTTKENNLRIDSHKEVVGNFIWFSADNQNLKISKDFKKVLWGVSQSPQIYSLKIEKQVPTEIIQYDFFGNTEYFWYYEDLQSDKPYDEWEIYLDDQS